MYTLGWATDGRVTPVGMSAGCSTAGRRFAEATPDDAGRSTVVAVEAGKPVEVGAEHSIAMAEESTVEESTAVAT